MMPEVESHHRHHPTGHRRLDLVLPVCALFVSIVSLGLALIHGKAMERMADANARLVQANSWPFLQYVTGNADDKGNLVISLGVHNAGVGPAKVESFEVLWQGRPVKDGVTLLERCCGLTPADLQAPVGGARKLSAVQQLALAQRQSRSAIATNFSAAGATGVLEAHQTENFLVLPLTARTAKVWGRLNAARFQLQTRACYCSVFDECWTSDLRTLDSADVKACPALKVPFGG